MQIQKHLLIYRNHILPSFASDIPVLNPLLIYKYLIMECISMKGGPAMAATGKLKQRSFLDRRSTKDRRDRWWRVFLRRAKMMDERRSLTDRRMIPEKRSEWERISKWSSAPKLQPYRFPYFRAISRFNDFPFW